jgi:hypothetical protein
MRAQCSPPACLACSPRGGEHEHAFGGGRASSVRLPHPRTREWGQPSPRQHPAPRRHDDQPDLRRREPPHLVDRRRRQHHAVHVRRRGPPRTNHVRRRLHDEHDSSSTSAAAATTIARTPRPTARGATGDRGATTCGGLTARQGRDRRRGAGAGRARARSRGAAGHPRRGRLSLPISWKDFDLADGAHPARDAPFGLMAETQTIAS